MLHFDGDLRRVYEVPENASFTTDGSGYRIYTGTGNTSITSAYLWSRWVDWHNDNKWSTLAFSKQGGAFRDTVDGVDVFATFDLREINSWQIVPANYPHEFTVNGNVFKDVGLGSTFDSTRNTAQGIIANVNFADSLQTVQISSGSGLSAEQVAQLNQIGSDARWTYMAHYHKREESETDQTITLYAADGTTPLRVFDANTDGTLINPRFVP